MQPASNLTLQTQVNALNEKTTQMQNTITEMQSQTRQVHLIPFKYFLMIIILFFATDDDWYRLDDESDGSC